MGVLADLLEGIDNVIRRSSPFIAAGIFVGSFYWTAVTYGAITSKLKISVDYSSSFACFKDKV